MSLYSKKGLTERIRRGKEARAQLVSSNLDKGIALQIRATRDRRKITQAQLAQESGMKQNNLSRLESPDYGKQTISSLKRIAKALDVALVVRLVPFSQYIDWLSGTSRVDAGISIDSMAVPSFVEEEISGVFDKPQITFGQGAIYMRSTFKGDTSVKNTNLSTKDMYLDLYSSLPTTLDYVTRTEGAQFDGVWQTEQTHEYAGVGA